MANSFKPNLSNLLYRTEGRRKKESRSETERIAIEMTRCPGLCSFIVKSRTVWNIFFLHGLCNGEHFFGFWVLVAQPSWPLVFSMRLQVKSTKTRSGTTKSGRKADDDSEDDIEKEKARWQ